MKKIEKLRTLVLLGFVASFVFAGTASAHVTVKPSEVATASYVTFSISVPNEKDTATTSVKILIPETLSSVMPTVKPGWTIIAETADETSQEGDVHEDQKVISITWSGGAIPKGQRDDFTFSAKTSADAEEIQWKAYQTYADGTTVSWDKTAEDQPKKGDGSPDFSLDGPFSVTNVVATPTATQLAVGQTDTQILDADKKTERAFYTAIAAMVVAFIALIIATRPAPKKK